MNNLELKFIAVRELDTKEKANTNGGAFPFWTIPVSIYLYDNRNSLFAGMKDAFNVLF